MAHRYDHPRPALTTDIVLVREGAGQVEVLLIQRRHDPFVGEWALPGGFVDEGEDLEESARRELQEETEVTGVSLHQLGAFGEPGRDPRGWVVSVAFWTWLEGEVSVRAADDAADARWWPLDALPALAFDHGLILQRALERIREVRRLQGQSPAPLPRALGFRPVA
ncbi:MAG: NUDIX domain-containing protein [Anaerolineales bacterium]